MQLSLHAYCRSCNRVRLLWGPHTINSNADLDAAETLVDIKGSADAHCPICHRVEEVALYHDGQQVEPWMDADEYERLNGPAAGALPAKPDIGGDRYRRSQAVIREVIDLLNNTRHTFRSKQIERARRLLQSLLDGDASPSR